VVAAQLVRPTESTGLHLQQIGRALRPSEGKECAIILDHVGNIGSVKNGVWMLKHGTAAMDREWSLEGLKKKTSDKLERDIVIQTCPECYAVHEPATICPYCGFERPLQVRTIKHTKGELQELKEIAMQQRRKEDRAAFTIESLIKLGRERGYKSPEFWAKMKMKGRNRK